MKIAIIAAMQEEITYLLKIVKPVSEKEVNNYTISIGTLGQHQVYVANSMVGKVAASMLVTTLIDHFEIDLIINIGVAGGIKDRVNHLDIVGCEYALYHDVDVRAFDYRYGQVPGNPSFYRSNLKLVSIVKEMNINVGAFITGDTFVTSYAQISDALNNHFKDFNVLAVDMETAAFAQSCYMLEVPFFALRVISDVIGEEKQMDVYESSVNDAMEKECEVLKEILLKLE